MIETLPAPTRVSLDVTSACNLRCLHCRHASQSEDRMWLTFAEIQRVIDDASRLNIFRLTISGGEPMLRADIMDILLYALTSRIGRVFLSTNGQYVDKHNFKSLLPFRSRLTIKISIDGPPAIHDWVRGNPGACMAARGAVEIMLSEGFDVQVTTTLMRGNLSCIKELVAWSSSAGCSKHNLVEVVPVGRAEPNMVLARNERKQALQSILEARAQYAHRHYSIVAKLPFAEERNFGLHCSGGTEECGVLADGSVVGCRLMPDLIEGNIKKSSLAEIWSDPEAFACFRCIHRGCLSAPCNTCEHGDTCLGGCHAFARALSGDFFHPDARCGHSNLPIAHRKESICWAASS
jgi:AdoMet-dependent heme synthase